MLLNTKTMIPEVYGKERQIQVFTKLLDIILSCFKYEIDNIGDVYDAMKCPKEFLPLLAKTLNFEYNYADTVTANRRILKVFAFMEKWRGSEWGLRIATALSLSSLIVSTDNDELDIAGSDTNYLEALQDINISYDLENGMITIDYPNVYTLVRYLLDYVRPVGVYIKLRSIVQKNINTDAMLIYADIENRTREYDPEIDSKVQNSYINFSSFGDPEYKETLLNKWTEHIQNNSTFSIEDGD